MCFPFLHHSWIRHTGLHCYTPLSTPINKPAHFNEHTALIWEVYVYGSSHPPVLLAPPPQGSLLICLTFGVSGRKESKGHVIWPACQQLPIKNGANVGLPGNMTDIQRIMCISSIVIKLVQSHWNSFQIPGMCSYKHENQMKLVYNFQCKAVCISLCMTSAQQKKLLSRFCRLESLSNWC